MRRRLLVHRPRPPGGLSLKLALHSVERPLVLLVAALVLSGCAAPTGGAAATPEPVSLAALRPDAAAIQACRRDAASHLAEVQFPGAYRAFQLVRDETAATAPAPPSAVLEQWAAILCNYDLAHLSGELRYLGPADESDGRVAWRFRVTTVPAGQPLRQAVYDLAFATTPGGAIVSAS